jgi:hypothetical protein
VLGTAAGVSAPAEGSAEPATGASAGRARGSHSAISRPRAIPAAVSRTTRNSPSAVAARSACPVLPPVPASAIAVSTARPMALPRLRVVEAMPLAMPCSPGATLVAAAIHMDVHTMPWPTPEMISPGTAMP